MNPNNPNYNPANSKSPDVTPVLPNPALNPNANYNYNPANSQSPLVTPVNNMVVGSGPANMEFANYSANLSKALGALNPTQAKPKGPEITIENVGTDDPYGQMLQSLSNSANASTKALIASIQASRANQANTINSQYDNYKKGLQLLGIQHNDAQSTPDLLMGHIKQAENEQNAKIQALDIEEKKLLMDAETAQKNNDLETLKAKMDRVKQIKEEKNQALKDISDQLTAETSIAENQAHVIYETLNTLSENEKEIFLQQVAKKYNIPLGTLVTALADEKTKRTEKVKTGKAGTSSGGGGSEDFGDETVGDDFQGLYDAIDEDYNNPDYIDEKGFLTAEYVGNILNNLPEGISRMDFLERIKDKLYLNRYKFVKRYGITKVEFDKLKK